MKKALLWGMGECFRKYIAVIKYYEWSQQFCVVGVTSNMSIYDEYYGYKYINKNQINDTEFDFIIILADDPDREIYREAIGKGIAGEYILNYRVLMLPGFDLNRCTALKRNPPSIFSNNCWGGFTYHSLDLEFTSPFINLSVEDTDYMKLLKNPKHYMQEELQWISMVLNRGKKFYYPLVKCGDITF